MAPTTVLLESAQNEKSDAREENLFFDGIGSIASPGRFLSRLTAESEFDRLEQTFLLRRV